MTADDFTKAARAEAERRWPRGQADGRELPGHARMSRRIGFEIGALWAAAQDPTDAEVEAAAEAWRAHSHLHHPVEGSELACGDCGYAFGWPGLSASEERRRYREHVARAVLSAARAARRRDMEEQQ